MIDQNKKYNNIHTEIYLIDDLIKAREYLDKILDNELVNVISIDCEAVNEMSRFGKLSLIQIGFSEYDCYKNIKSSTAYVLDMTKLNYIEELDRILSNSNIVKIFHDANEDCSLLLNSNVAKNIENIFDTQVANRIIFQKYNNQKTTKDSSISLKNLLDQCLNITKDKNCEIQIEMKNNKTFWGKRPLTSKMLKYASEDVLYLEKLYIKFISLVNENVVKKILDDSKVSIVYSSINLNIKFNQRYNLINSNINEVKGMLKTIQENCVYIKLNIGVSGKITDKITIDKIILNCYPGEIYNFKVKDYDYKYKLYIVELKSEIKVKLSEKAKEYIPSNYKINKKLTTDNNQNCKNLLNNEINNIISNSYFKFKYNDNIHKRNETNSINNTYFKENNKNNSIFNNYNKDLNHDNYNNKLDYSQNNQYNNYTINNYTINNSNINLICNSDNNYFYYKNSNICNNKINNIHINQYDQNNNNIKSNENKNLCSNVNTNNKNNADLSNYNVNNKFINEYSINSADNCFFFDNKNLNNFTTTTATNTPNKNFKECFTNENIIPISHTKLNLSNANNYVYKPINYYK